MRYLISLTPNKLHRRPKHYISCLYSDKVYSGLLMSLLSYLAQTATNKPVLVKTIHI